MVAPLPRPKYLKIHDTRRASALFLPFPSLRPFCSYSLPVSLLDFFLSFSLRLGSTIQLKYVAVFKARTIPLFHLSDPFSLGVVRLSFDLCQRKGWKMKSSSSVPEFSTCSTGSRLFLSPLLSSFSFLFYSLHRVWSSLISQSIESLYSTGITESSSPFDSSFPWGSNETLPCRFFDLWDRLVVAPRQA